MFENRYEELQWLNRSLPQPKHRGPLFQNEEERLSWLNRVSVRVHKGPLDLENRHERDQGDGQGGNRRDKQGG